MTFIRTFEPMPTRPCRYCLAMKDDCVFLDLDIDENGCLYLVRISFDGYGCCEPNPKGVVGNIEVLKSHQLIKQIESNEFIFHEANKIICEYLKSIKEYLWEDALEEYALM